MNNLNIPSEETHLRIADALERISKTREKVDMLDLPGNKTLLAGDRSAGFLGFVPASEVFTGTQLATEIGLSAGNAFNTETPWIKYIWKGKICFTPLKPIRYNLSWDSIYNAGAVYGTGDYGLLPPMGRMGPDISIDGSDNSINSPTANFLGDKTEGMQYADTVGAVGDTLVLAGWSNSANNGEFEITSITNTKIVLSGNLATEAGSGLKRFYNKDNRVLQDASVGLNGITGKVRLFKGAHGDYMDYSTSNRLGPGKNNEWNWIILQLHEHAKLKDWNYPQYVDSDLGDFGVYLTNKDLLTHNSFGSGSYQWTQEVDIGRYSGSYGRASRGNIGASTLYANHSWGVSTNRGFRPVLEFTQTASL